MSVLRYYGCTDLCIRIFGSLVCNINLISDLCLVLCCDIYRDTLISIMYPACMITVHNRKSRALQGATTGTPEGSLARPHPRPRQGASWLPYGPSRCPLRLYLPPPPTGQTPKYIVFFRSPLFSPPPRPYSH